MRKTNFATFPISNKQVNYYHNVLLIGDIIKTNNNQIKQPGPLGNLEFFIELFIETLFTTKEG